MFKDLGIFMIHLNYYNVGQLNLLSEIFKNNRKLSLLVSEKLIKNIKMGILNQTNFNSGYDPSHINLLKNFICVEPFIIKENCDKIINLIFDDASFSQILFMNKSISLISVKRVHNQNTHIFRFDLNLTKIVYFFMFKTKNH